jgi:transposase
MRIGLRRKRDPAFFNQSEPQLPLHLQQGPSCGALWLVHSIAKELGIVDALGPTRDGKLALWQICARVIDQGSRLSAVRLASTHAACDILGLDTFNESALYANLDWLTKHQASIENRLFARLPASEEPGLYLYDVTSSYLEGEHNELGAFGYNRDGKKRKSQVVIGLLCNASGIPISIEVFPGNTSDPKTVASQVVKVTQRFGGGKLTLVGDRGMIRGPQINELPEDIGYITAISKPQIESLLVEGFFQMSLFDQAMAEVISSDGIRYVLRRNPIRAQEMTKSRDDKSVVLANAANRSTTYLQEHPRAKPETQHRNLTAKIKQYKAASWISLQQNDRTFSIQINEEARAEVAHLDGCYVIKTNLPTDMASKETVHGRYRDLAHVEQAFRVSKTMELELRPIHVRLENHTRAHAFVVMLAYRIVQELAKRWVGVDMRVQEGLDSLAMITTQQVTIDTNTSYQIIPEPSAINLRLLTAARVNLPSMLTNRKVVVTTKSKLNSRRGKTRKTWG